MPAKSARQLRAMYAAASGHSTLGIPQSVGQEFVDATPKKVKSSLMHHEKAKTGFRKRVKGGYS